MSSCASRLSDKFRFMVLTFVISGGAASLALAQDPMASNNGLYPSAEDWQGRYNIANLDYPNTISANAWSTLDMPQRLTLESAAEYVARIKTHLEPTLRTLVEQPENWDPTTAGWYDLVWSGDGAPGPNGTDPTSGREALMNTYSGQIMPPETFSPPYRPTTYVQNHAVIYYNSAAATMLGDMWENVYAPDISRAVFPDGSIVVKIEAVTNTPENWSVIEGASMWHVFRPTTEDQANNVPDMKPQVLPVRPIQIAVRVKDSVAAPETGWVFIAFTYDATSQGESAWDRFVPVGMQWGNDPDLTSDPSGLPPGAKLQETWINPDAPAFTRDTFGWGGRLAGPMDVATRHNVITASGERYQGDNHLRASSCQSCHGASEFPFTANLYPSPNRSFPRDGEPFLLYDPGSRKWAEWFQNRPGTEAMSARIGGQGLDYDMALMFALSAYNAAVGNDGFVQKRFDVH
ncbi:hypothetical protein [Parasulfitobacter algicola]|uniref:Cytochrome c domain-containing protein n=1 Tax=Parasulfitobacter algicola TaxID=2614809 RepID=A0ABX2IV23_9RHOB|nr:hypothetical protein [Sulfitobacter algicola]NSX54043.1 hypothetical protein [Sulfitobacter algicola]